MPKVREKTDEFEVVDESGKKHIILAWREFDISIDLDGEVDRIGGLHEYRLSNGNAVNKKEGFFQEVQTGRVLRRVTST
jgi:hypothetical protein